MASSGYSLTAEAGFGFDILSRFGPYLSIKYAGNNKDLKINSRRALEQAEQMNVEMAGATQKVSQWNAGVRLAHAQGILFSVREQTREAETSLEQVRLLAKRGAVPPIVLANAESSLSSAQAREAEAKATVAGLGRLQFLDDPTGHPERSVDGHSRGVVSTYSGAGMWPGSPRAFVPRNWLRC